MAAKSSSTVEHELRCFGRRRTSPTSRLCVVMRNAVLRATRVPGRSSRPIVPCTSAIRVLRAFSLAHDPAHNLLLKPGCCHFAQVIGVTSDLRITFPILLKICASTRWLWGVACLQSAAGITRFGGPVSLVARGSLRPDQRCRLDQTLVAPAASGADPPRLRSLAAFGRRPQSACALIGSH